MKKAILCATISALLFALPAPAQNRESPLDALVVVLAQTDDPQFQRDILNGMSQALRGRREVTMPSGWAEVETRLGQSNHPEVRALVQSLSLTFGSSRALSALRQTVVDEAIETGLRRRALESLVSARDPQLPETLYQLLDEPSLRSPALRALATYERPEIPAAVLKVYPELGGAEKRDAISTLTSRIPYAMALLDAVGAGSVSSKDLTADVIQQLRNLKNAEIDRRLAEVWGVARESTADKQKEIERYTKIYRAGGSQPGDATRGRAVYARVCQQCHTLFDVGGAVGPDLTGSNRGDLDYILQNMVDPNAVIPNDYRGSTFELKDDRVITGIIKREDPNSITIASANETLIVSKADIASVHQSELSMMPEGLLDTLGDQEVRDLIYYLRSPAQAPLVASTDTLPLFFNERDVLNWSGNMDLWKVENGEIVGAAPRGLRRNEFLRSDMIFGDFRLICEVKLVPDAGNSGIQFRSEALPEGEVKGYQADAGVGWWGKLYEEHGRGLLWDRSGDAFVRKGEWNTYEIVAVGHRIRTAINGRLCVDLDDPRGALKGVIALQLHSGGPQEVRYRKFQLELEPSIELKTKE